MDKGDYCLILFLNSANGTPESYSEIPKKVITEVLQTTWEVRNSCHSILVMRLLYVDEWWPGCTSWGKGLGSKGYWRPKMQLMGCSCSWKCYSSIEILLFLRQLDKKWIHIMYKTKCLQSFEICDTDIVILVEKNVKVLGVL